MSVTSIMACANDSFLILHITNEVADLFCVTSNGFLEPAQIETTLHTCQDLYIPALYQPWMSVTCFMACAKDSFLILPITYEVAAIYCVTSNGPPEPAQIETTSMRVKICTFQHFISRG